MSTCPPLLLSHERQGKHRAVGDVRTEPHSGHSLLRHSSPEQPGRREGGVRSLTLVYSISWPIATRPWGLRLGVFQETNTPTPQKGINR